MKNPFRYGEVVELIHFCNRKEELIEIDRAIKNRYSFWLYSPRRFGKTSLILKAFKEISDIKTIYFDMYNIQSLDDFAKKYSQLLALDLFDWKEDLKALSKKFSQYFSALLPKIILDSSGNSSFSLETQSIEKQADIETILNIPEKIALKTKQQICIAFDEFQEIKRIEPFLINWMRSAFQLQKKVSYIFLGSKQSLMESIFADSNSPFYEFGYKMDINHISFSDLSEFIKKRFAATNLKVSDKNVNAILEKSDCHPHFTQFFASVVWEMISEGVDQTRRDFTDKWLNRIIKSQSIIFQNIYDQLTSHQRNTLKAIAFYKDGDEIFSNTIRQEYYLPGSSSLTKSLKSLMQKGIIHKSGKIYRHNNPVFKEWIIQINS